MIRIAVCEDELNMLDDIGRMVLEYANANPQFNISLHSFKSAFDLLESRNGKNASFHIYLLDILMPLMNGIELGRHIRKDDDQAVIIFMTSSREYALESFKVSPMQYLLKPVHEITLFSALEKACQRVRQAADSNVLVRVKGGIACIRYHQISFIEYMNHTMTYHLTTGKTLTTMVLRESFTDCTDNYLKDPRFIKPHASFVLNMDHVQVMTAREFEMMGGEIVPISKRAYAQIRKQFTDYILARHGGVAQ